jgi:alkanesulfonate monooxygenase SsuD/methylene tetrahydromethanopterin reductase-like flavin-dependent oxidoreductase (luciferase family)
MTASGALVSIGLAGSVGPAAIAAIAPEVERAGFHALWINDTPGGDSLACLAAAAEVTDRLVLATGVIPIDRRPPDEIAHAIAGHVLPEGRLAIGIGSGGISTGALERMRGAIATLRASTTARIVVGALGPRMRRLAVTDGDGVLLNWLTPDAAAAQSRELRGIAPDAQVALYVRTALDPAARDRLEAEAARYGTIPAYADNFARIGAQPLDTVLPRPGDDGAAAGLASYRSAVDEVVLRAVTAGDDVEAYLRFVAGAARLL